MSWYAVDAVDDAFEATKALLAPFDARQWLKLAVVVFFLGSAGSVNPSASAGSVGDGDALPVVPNGDVVPSITLTEIAPLVVGVVGVSLAIGLAYLLVGSVMEFVFVESLRRRTVRIRAYADQHLGRGVRLFGFRVVLGLVVVLPAIGATLIALTALAGDAVVTLGLVVVLVPVFVALGLLVAVANTVTTNFVVPVMIVENVGVLAGWRRLWPTLTGEWRQYGVYFLVWIVLAFGAGVLASVVGAVVGAALFVPLALAGIVVVPAAGGLTTLLSNPVALAVGAVVLLGYVLALTATLAVAFVPVRSYLRYHALLVLGDTNPEFDLLPDLRRDVRER